MNKFNETIITVTITHSSHGTAYEGFTYIFLKKALAI